MLKVTLLQTDIRWAQPEENIREVQHLLLDHPGSDLYVLPEMWSTGFATQPEGIAAEEEDNPALLWMQEEACRRRCAFCGSLAVHCADGTFRNRHYFVDGRTDCSSHDFKKERPDNSHFVFEDGRTDEPSDEGSDARCRTLYYDKHHLFTYGHEDRYYTPGQLPTIVRYAGFRLLLLTCYDLRFPVWSRYADGREFDAIVLVANWPQNRQAAWQILTRARAVENQCYLIAVNRVGDDHYSHYQGASCVVDCYGKTLGHCRTDRVEALTVELDLAELQRRRQKFRVLDDRDPFLWVDDSDL